nr:glycoprotein-N-acetylgalactosamine [Haemonchus contortus]
MRLAVWMRKIRKASRTTLPRPVFLLVFMVGSAIGLYVYLQQSKTRIDIVTVDELYDAVDHFERDNMSVADILNKTIRLHCVLLTDNRTGNRSLNASKIWASRCKSFSLYKHTKKLSYWWEAFRVTFVHHWTKADWFLFVEPATYFVPENVLLFLLPFYKSINKPVAFGSERGGEVLPFIILSIESLEWIASSSVACKQQKGKLLYSYCLSRIGITLIETRDQLGRHRILPHPPHEFTNRENRAEEASEIRKMRHPVPGGPMCCSPTAFAVMNIHYRLLESAYYFVSIVHTSGLEIDYNQTSFRQKLEQALEKSKEGLPPTIIWQ